MIISNVCKMRNVLLCPLTSEKCSSSPSLSHPVTLLSDFFFPNTSWNKLDIGQKHMQRKYYWSTLGRKSNINMENRHVDKRGDGEGGTDWESSIDIYTLPCVKQIASGKLLYSTGSSAWCSEMTKMGGMDGGKEGRFKRDRIYVYLWLIHFVVQQKLTL